MKQVNIFCWIKLVDLDSTLNFSEAALKQSALCKALLK